MPKCYSEQERAYIKKRLKEEAADCMFQYGIRRTTVDEIVRRVNIPKGTFYLFYKSKELLLFDVLLEQHDLIQEKIIQPARSIDPASFTAEQLTDLLCSFFHMMEEVPILNVLHSGEVELLARKLPPETVEAHFGHDTDMIRQLFSALPIKKDLDVNVFSSVFHAVFFASLHKKEIGEDHYEEALRTLLYGVAVQMIP